MSTEHYIFPTSYAQQRLWFLEQMEPGLTAFNIPAALRMSGELNVRMLERSLEEIVGRHEVLRSTFTAIDGEPFQVVRPAAAVGIPVVDLRELGAEGAQSHALRLAAQEARIPFDLGAGPLLRVTLLVLGEGEYVLLLTMHHIVSDGWSMGVFIRELSQLYGELAAGRPGSLPELPIQYSDYTLWQRESLTGEFVEEHLSYWREQLGGELPALQLPTDYPRPPAQSYLGARHRVVIPRALAEPLKALSRREGCTLFMTLLAGLQTLLQRYTGQERLVVGTSVAGRNHEEIEGLIGFFLNTLALRADLAGDPSFRELLGRVRELTLGAIDHQDLPIEMLMQELHLGRDRAREQLFQVLFIFQTAPRPALDLPGLSVSLLEVDHGTAKFDLTFELAEEEGELRGWIEYSTDLFSDETVAHMAGHFTTLLAEAVADPDRRISSLRMLTAGEERLLLGRAEPDSEHGVERGPSKCVQELFEEQAAAKPEATALEFGSERLTYRELNERANRLARHLIRRGVGPESLVGISAERSVELVVGLLGVLKAGGAYVPLDPNYPHARLASMLEDAAVGLLLTTRRLAERLPELKTEVACLDDRDAFAAESAENPARRAAPANAAYVIYTSGSTGRPKGVVIEHRSLAGFVQTAADEYGIGPGDRVLQFASVSFDTSAEEIYPCLTRGATLVLREEGMFGAASSFLRRCGELGITVLDLPTAYWHELTAEPSAEEWGAAASLRLVIIGGERALPERVAAWGSHIGQRIRLVNTYGPTETTIVATACDLTHADETRGAREVSIGRPLRRRRAYVLDRRMNLVPAGVPGELHLGGDGLARGYLGRPDLTAAAFIPDPFSAEPGARLYRTGDLARYRPDGSLEVVGRIDRQVKIRGYRVELGEIEAALSRHESVREYVVVARQDGPGEQRVIAYVVPSPGHTPSPHDLAEFLKESLPQYMVPSAFVTLEALPLTPNLKIDLGALPAPEGGALGGASASDVPRTPLEEIVHGICTEVLRLEGMGVHDNLFDLGCHSLLATKIVARIREAVGVELPLMRLFESPTVAGLARGVEECGELAGTSVPPPAPVPRDRAIPLSFPQERLWFLEQYAPGAVPYNVPRATRIRGALRVEVLERALTELVRRHEILRTSFPTVEGAPVQHIHPPRAERVPLIDLSSLPVEVREAQVQQLILQEGRRPFDLARGPLFRVMVLRLREQEHVLVLVEHHLIHDGWTQGVLLRDFFTLFGAFLAGAEESPLAELPIQYADYAYWQRQWLRGEFLESELDFWGRRLAGAPEVMPLPLDRPRPPVQSFRGAEQVLVLPAALMNALKSLSAREGATLFMTMFAAFAALLSRHTGAADLVFGSGIANRRWRETEGLLGMLINTVVLRADLAGDPTFRELLGRVRETCLEAYQHQDVPFEKVVERLRPERTPSHTPVFQVMFSFMDTPAPDVNIPGLDFEVMDAHNRSAKFDINVVVMPHSERREAASERLAGSDIDVLFEYNTDVFDGETVARLLEHYRRVLEQVVKDASARVSRLPLLSEGERRQLLAGWSGTAADYPRESCVHSLFERRAAEAPEAPAVLDAEGQLSYRELNERANRLAHYLRARGVGPEVCVGVCVGRGVETAVCLLAVLKAGGAYVPLDPNYPPERLAFMLRQAGVRLVLADRRTAATLPGDAAELVRLDTVREAVASQPSSDLHNVTRADGLAYVSYTSGSTGEPKGVGVPHRAVVRLVCNTNYASFGADEVFLQLAPLSFDASTFEVWGALLNGARLALMPDGPPSLEEVAEALGRYGVTTLWLTAGLFHQMIEYHPGALGGLRQLLAGGDVLSPEKVNRYLRGHHGGRLINGYGPTENTTFSCCHVMTEALPDGRSVPIGRPITNTTAYVLDAHMCPAPVGVHRELYLGGDGLARGYVNRPDLTAERFVPDPFSSEPGARLYRTGDLVRWLADGTLEFIGRFDGQVKVRGYRIELGEIEAALSSHASVGECVVAAREEVSGDKRLVAYFVADGAEDPSVAELRRHLRERLPDYMVPAAFVTLDALPLTANGKVDRRRLPAAGVSDAPAEYVEPRGETERVVAQVWAEVLGVGRVGARDNFFELGGHSLLATQVVSRLREVCGVELPLRRLFESATVEGVAAQVEAELRDGTGATSAPPITPGRLGAGPALSDAQQWSVERPANGHDADGVITPLRLEGTLEGAALSEEVRRVVKQVWAHVLGVEYTGPHDDFFDLGGHSLMAMQLISRLREVCGVELSLRRFFEAATVEDVAAQVEAELRDGTGAAQSTLLSWARVGAELPLSFAQQRLWFLDQLEPGQAAYNVPAALRLEGPLHVSALSRAFSEVVRRHEALRTCFRVRDDRPVQVILPAEELSLPVVDLSALNEEEQETGALALAGQEARRPFDLAEAAPLRLLLVRLHEERHLLVAVMHHIISDGWSLGVLVREVAALYNAYMRGEESPLAELPIQYGDYAVWQRAWLEAGELDRQLAYWRQQFGGELTVLELPADHPRPASPSYRGERHHFLLPAALVRRLEALGRAEGATLFMVLLAAFQLLLSRYTGQREVVVGTPIANRTRAEVEGLIGFFVNTLALRTDLAGDPTFRGLLARVREVTLGAYAHQEVPFERLVEELGGAGRQPLFRAMFTYQNAPGAEVRLTGVRASDQRVETRTSKFDLLLTASGRDGGLACAVEYSTELFEAETIELMCSHLCNLLEAAAAAPDARVSGLRLMSEGEERRVLVGWNETRTDYDRAATLHSLIERQAALTPDASALVYLGGEMTYAELNTRAEWLARRLRGMGVGAETRVGVLMGRSPGMVVALLGVLKAGGAYVPLDANYPAERLAFMLADAGARVVVTEVGLAALAMGLCAEAGAEPLFVEGLEAVPEELGGSEEARAATAANLAYVIYTSGSTGRPKGVAITHAGAAAFVQWAADTYTREELSGVLASTSICFDLSVFELFATLAVGGTVVLAESALELSALPAAGRVTLVNTVPSAMAELVRLGGLPAGVRVVNLAGEALKRGLVERVYAAGAVERVYNLYGPSEDTTYSTFALIERGAGAPVTIGRPIANTRAYVLDRWMRPVPEGVTGELYLGGEGLARGYLNRPALTAERFAPDPFSTEAGARLYRTGDLVRYLPDGRIDYLGRADQQVKVRGYRIELGEIEAALSSHASVGECVVAAREEVSGDKRLVAYFVADGAEDPSAAELRRHLRERLPDYMVPAAFVTLDALPLTANGKVDRRRLPAAGMSDAPAEYVEPRGETERVVAQVWAEVLGVGRVGARDNFFELGGHSLLATQTVFRLREVCGVELPLRHLLEEPTVEELAAKVEAELRGGGHAARTLNGTGGGMRPDPLPLSYAQQRLWFLYQLEPGSVAYNVPAAVRLGGRLRVDVLARALSEVVRRHEALRTCFRLRDGRPVQVILPPRESSLPVVDLSALDEEERETEALRLASDEAGRPFDLAEAAPLRLLLVRLGEEEHALVLVMHHIISDGWSMGVLVREVAALYEAFTKGEPSPLAELPVQYADYTVWQREWLEGGELDRQVSYWRERLRGAPTLELPMEKVPERNGAARAGRVRLSYGAALSEELRRLSRSEGVTLFMTLLAALDTLLYRYSGQSDIVVGTGAANRSHSDTKGLIGFFVNMLPLRNDLSGNPTFRQLLGRVRRAALEAYAHQDVPFDKLVERLQRERTGDRTPLFKVVLVLNDALAADAELGGLSMSRISLDAGPPHFDLTFSLADEGGVLECVVDYDAGRFARGDVERMAEHLRALLAAAAADPEQRLLDMELGEGAVDAQPHNVPGAPVSYGEDQFTFELS